MLGVDDAGMDVGVVFRRLAAPSPGGFNPGPLTIFDTQGLGRLRMDFHLRPGIASPVLGDLAVFGIIVGEEATARCQDQGILFGQVGCAHRTLQRFPVNRQGIVTHLFQNRRI